MELNTKFPDFTANTTFGCIKFYEWLGNSWGVLFSYPGRSFAASLTELGDMAKLHHEFANREVKVAALSCDSLRWNKEWIAEIMTCSDINIKSLPYPIIDDIDLKLAGKFQILDPETNNAAKLCLTGNALFLIDPKKRLRQRCLYPACLALNFSELLRSIDALQLTEKHKRRVATAEGWTKGSEVMIQPSVLHEEYNKYFANDIIARAMPSRKQYMISTTLP